MPHKLAVQLYDLWAASNFIAYPFPGGMLDQPYWLLDDFHQLSAMDGWHSRDAERRQDKKQRGTRPPEKRITFDEL